MDIARNVALVTGAGSGIGRASALRLAREGASVVVADVDEDGGRETARLIGEGAAFVRADVASEEDARAMVAFAEETYGGLDILHNNAGVFLNPRYPESDAATWSRMLDINLRGVILGTQAALPALRRRGGGAIVNTASMAGITGFPPEPVYAATKGGVVIFTASLVTLKDEANIRVNCVCPGVVDTPMLDKAAGVELARERRRASGAPILSPDDIADAVVELVRDDTLAGRAMLIPNGRPRELAPQLWRGGLG